MIGIGSWGRSLNRGLVETRRVFESSISKDAFPFILQPGVCNTKPDRSQKRRICTAKDAFAGHENTTRGDNGGDALEQRNSFWSGIH